MSDINIQEMLNLYVVPWVINIAIAAAIFVIGRWIATVLVNVTRKLLVKSGIDDMLVNFVCSNVKAVLMLFIIVASLNQLGVNTTSFSLSCEKPSQLYISLKSLPVKSVVNPIL